MSDQRIDGTQQPGPDVVDLSQGDMLPEDLFDETKFVKALNPEVPDLFRKPAVPQGLARGAINEEVVDDAARYLLTSQDQPTRAMGVILSNLEEQVDVVATQLASLDAQVAELTKTTNAILSKLATMLDDDLDSVPSPVEEDHSFPSRRPGPERSQVKAPIPTRRQIEHKKVTAPPPDFR